MHALVGVFQNDRADTEIVNSALETLTNIMTAKTFVSATAERGNEYNEG